MTSVALSMIDSQLKLTTAHISFYTNKLKVIITFSSNQLTVIMLTGSITVISHTLHFCDDYAVEDVDAYLLHRLHAMDWLRSNKFDIN